MFTNENEQFEESKIHIHIYMPEVFHPSDVCVCVAIHLSILLFGSVFYYL